MSLCVMSVACPQSFPFAPLVFWTSSLPPSVPLPLLFPSSIRPPDTSLRCVLSGCVYLPLHSAVFTASIHLCLFSPAAPSYIKSARDISHTHTHTPRRSHMICKGKQWTGKNKTKLRTVGICLTGSAVSQSVVMFVAQHELLKQVWKEERQDDIITADTGAAGG